MKQSSGLNGNLKPEQNKTTSWTTIGLTADSKTATARHQFCLFYSGFTSLHIAMVSGANLLKQIKEGAFFQSQAWLITVPLGREAKLSTIIVLQTMSAVLCTSFIL